MSLSGSACSLVRRQCWTPWMDAMPDLFSGSNAFKVDTNYGNITYGGTHTTTVNKSGGTDINAASGDVNISGDVVGGVKSGK